MMERVLTITGKIFLIVVNENKKKMILGDDGIRMKALEIVLEKLLDDPHHDSIPSVNYLNEKNSSSNEFQSFNDRKFYLFIKNNF